MRSGDVVWNPLTGEKALLLESGEETSGEHVLALFAVEEGGFVPGGEHVHDVCTEHFDVQQGQITFLVNGEERVLGAGEQLTVPPGAWHRWWNSGAGEVRIKARVEPALRFEEMISVLWGLCADGHTNAKGTPSPLYGALILDRYSAEIRLRKPPHALQRVLLPPLAAVARRRGLDQVIERYLDPDTHPSAEAGLGQLPENVMRRG
jgi:mannose-6-phosphate isomerase-like protein (cupin superfamily)